MGASCLVSFRSTNREDDTHRQDTGCGLELVTAARLSGRTMTLPGESPSLDCVNHQGINRSISPLQRDPYQGEMYAMTG